MVDSKYTWTSRLLYCRWSQYFHVFLELCHFVCNHVKWIKADHLGGQNRPSNIQSQMVGTRCLLQTKWDFFYRNFHFGLQMLTFLGKQIFLRFFFFAYNLVYWDSNERNGKNQIPPNNPDRKCWDEYWVSEKKYFLITYFFVDSKWVGNMSSFFY